MRAGKIAAVCLVLIVTIVATGVRVLTFWALNLEAAAAPSRVLMFAGVVLLVAAAVLLPVGFILDRAITSLRRSIETVGDRSNDQQESTFADNAALMVRWKWLQPISRALTGVFDQFRQREQTLRAQLNDLEIRHRVSQAERRQIEAVLEALRDGVIVTDAFDEVVMANQSAAATLDFDEEGAMHRPVDDLIHHARLSQLIREARQTADFAHARHVEMEFESHAAAGGASVPMLFDVSFLPVANHKQEVAGVVTILHDLTREREISQMKSDFVSKASHELRTPLASIRAYVEMLVDGDFASDDSQNNSEALAASGGAASVMTRPDSLLDVYRIIQSETDRLGRLIDNMLNISRIEAGIVQVQRERVDMKHVITRAVNTLEPQARGKNISLHTRLAEVDLSVEGDADMLHQVVLNLLSNAVKYTPEGGRVTVSADVEGWGVRPDDTRSPGGTSSIGRPSLTPSVVVSVADTGLGIPPEALPKPNGSRTSQSGGLFDKFFRIENYKRMAKGTGLGLNLCKQIIETVHHGQIGVESKLGMGSKFWFTVPMEYAGSIDSPAARQKAA